MDPNQQHRNAIRYALEELGFDDRERNDVIYKIANIEMERIKERLFLSWAIPK